MITKIPKVYIESILTWENASDWAVGGAICDPVLWSTPEECHASVVAGGVGEGDAVGVEDGLAGADEGVGGHVVGHAVGPQALR